MRKENVSSGYENVNVNMIFESNMYGKLTIEEILVANGHTIYPTSSIKCSSVVSRATVRIAFLLASLNYLKIFACDI